MKQAFLLHGTGGSSSDYFWFADTKTYLEAQGYKVWWELLPNTNEPEIIETLKYLKENAPELNGETIIIGHSSACPVILSWLEGVDTKVLQIALVGGYYTDIGGNSKNMLPKDGFDFPAIRSRASSIIMINSDNDPWGCTDKAARQTAIDLSATLVTPTHQGHMGSTTHGQPMKELVVLKKLLDT